MNRREFLKRSTLLLSGSMIAGSGALHKRVFANSAGAAAFSIDVVTDNPELAIRKIDRMIKASSLKNQRIDFTQYSLSGNHVGDIAFVRLEQLVDFYRLDDPFSNKLKETAKALSLPKSLENPTLVRFFSGSGSGAARYVNIFSGNVMLHQLSLKDNTGAFRAEGEKGHIDVAVKDGAVKIVSASCRHKTCMELGAISHAGQSLVCIPSRLRVVIEGENNDGLDGITF